MKFNLSCEEPIEAACRHFRLCGGCKFQHVPYDEQLSQKQTYIRSCFGQEVQSIIGCEPHWHYRNKMEYSFSQARSGEKFLGLMKRKGRVENLYECYLTHSWFIDVLKRVRQWWMSTDIPAYHPPSNQGLLRTLTLRRGTHSKETMVILTTSEEWLEEQELEGFKEAVEEVNSLILRRQIIKKKTPTHFEEIVLVGNDHIHEFLHDEENRQWCFRIRAASFFQPNTIQAEVIYQTAMQLANLEKGETILDLYCGTGSLGIFASKKVKKVIGVEQESSAIEDAQENFKLNNVDNMDVLQGDVEEILASLDVEPNTVIVDPPRAGLGAKTIEYLRALEPKKIIYVSCNPQTQAEDCRQLKYKIVILQPIDQFPHTPHIENIVLLNSV